MGIPQKEWAGVQLKIVDTFFWQVLFRWLFLSVYKAKAKYVSAIYSLCSEQIQLTSWLSVLNLFINLNPIV